MNFFQAIKSALSKYARFSGRSLRSEFWYFQLFATILSCYSIGTDYLYAHGWDNYPLFLEMIQNKWLYYLIIFIPQITVSVRRLHDVDRSGWWVLIPFIIIGLIPFLYWVCQKGDEGENRFGPEPLASDKKQ